MRKLGLRYYYYNMTIWTKLFGKRNVCTKDNIIPVGRFGLRYYYYTMKVWTKLFHSK